MRMWKSPKSAYLKRALSATLALGLAVGTAFAAPFISGAEDKVDLEHACSLTVNVASYTNEEEKADILSADIVVDMYLVAEAKALKGADGYTFEVTDSFKSISIPENVSDREWVELAKDAAYTVKDNADAILPAFTAESEDRGTCFEAKAEGMAAGLYLILARGKDDKEYFDTVKAQGTDEESIVTIANSDYHKYSFAPAFVALPTKDAVDGVINTANPGPWLYSAEIALKSTQEVAYSDLRINKDLLTYNGLDGKVTFVFDVEAELDGKNVYSNTVTFSFTDAGEEYKVIEHLPVGAVVTVTEVYSGTNYKCVSGDTKSETIRANEMVTVTFENEYSKTVLHGGSITNHFAPLVDADGNYIDEAGNILGENDKVQYTWSQWPESEEVIK